MKKLAVGILAHVDAGKTTLSEGLLFESGNLKRLGRVDHGDAFLDTDHLERERGITIFSKQAELMLPDWEVTLLDTPGHVDFSAEMERTLGVLDYAILVINGSDGVQGHTETLWRLLKRYGIPTFLFINKMDLPGTERAALLIELKSRLDDACADFGEMETVWEQAALCDEGLLDGYLERGRVEDEALARLVAERKLFPCYFGSALRLEGVKALLAGLGHYARGPQYPPEFGARVFKVARDPQGARLTYLKVTGGSLKVKTMLTGPDWEEKADQLRIYSGAKFRTVEVAEAGTVCAVTGLTRTYPGQGLGAEGDGDAPTLESVLTYQVILPDGCDAHTALTKLKTLEEEDPQLHIVWNEQLKEIHLRLMGEVQLEVLKRLAAERLGLAVEFGAGSIVYKETIADRVEGVGHYEPLRHYAEVHLLLEPGERGSGLQFYTACGGDDLDLGWQRLILTHLEEKTHLGVLIGAPITDMRITLVAGKGHLKHTEGGDFRQATYRAVRQGLMCAESILLEPWYAFRMELPVEHLGRAMTDIQRAGGVCDAPEQRGESVTLNGTAPVSRLYDYAMVLAAYTGGRGRFSCALKGYEPCPDQAEVVAAQGYQAERDLENTADSIFCGHGAGFTVKWDEVRSHMHLEGLRLDEPEPVAEEPAPPPRPGRDYAGSVAEDKELRAIYERTYGPVKRRDFQPTPRVENAVLPEKRWVPDGVPGPEYLLVDGYNIIYAWEALNAVAQESLDAARQLLMDLLSNYRGYKNCEIILVFDAYKVARSTGETSKYHNIYVVYTKHAETADAYIERATYEIGKNHRVRVATSDGLVQMIILGHGALRLSASAFYDEVKAAGGEMAAILARNNRKGKSYALRDAMERAKREE